LKKQTWIFLFVIAVVGTISAELVKSQLVTYISKPLIVVSVTGYFLSQVHNVVSSLKKWILAALFFSWVGDILLIFQERDPIFFLMGLSSFLLAHIFYIIFFHNVRVKEAVRSNVWLLLIVVIYYLGLITLLSPYLKDMKLPVRVYGIVISFMFLLAMHMYFIKNKIAGQWMVAGAVLFVISDSILAINKFYQPFKAADVLVMLTYGLAQLFIIEGAVRYIISAYKE
jgi:uncharacterized membrane protein YhhN